MKYPFRQEYRVTSPFGIRWLNGVQNYHNGIDLVCDDKTIISTDDGIVLVSQIVTDKNNRTWEWGNYVCVQTNEGKHVYYCHMESRAVKAGQKVLKGDKLGVMGNTGYSFGAHLHYEVRENNVAINPANYLGIKNEIGIATPIEGGDSMTPAEKKAFEALQKKVAEQETEIKTLKEYFEALCVDYDKHTSPIYISKSDIPAWADSDIKWLINNGYLKGSTGGKLNLSNDMLRQLVIMSRFGQDVFDKMESNG